MSAKNMMALEHCTAAVLSPSAQAVTWMPSGEEGSVSSRKRQKAEFQAMLTVMLCPSQELAQCSGRVAMPSWAALSWVPALPGLSSSLISVQGVSKSVNKSAVPAAHPFPTASLHKANEGLVVGDVVGPPGWAGLSGVALVRIGEGTLGLPALLGISGTISSTLKSFSSRLITWSSDLHVGSLLP